jgi:K+ transporter
MLHAATYNLKILVSASYYYTRMHNNYYDFRTVSAQNVATTTTMVRRILQYFRTILYAKRKPREAAICILCIILCTRIKFIHASSHPILTSCALGISVTREDLIIIIYWESNRKVKRKWWKMQCTRWFTKHVRLLFFLQ